MLFIYGVNDNVKELFPVSLIVYGLTTELLLHVNFSILHLFTLKSISFITDDSTITSRFFCRLFVFLNDSILV